MRAALVIGCILLVTLLAISCAFCDTRYVFHSQGYTTPEQNVYYHFFQFTDPSETVGLIGPTWEFDVPGGSALGVLWSKADSDGDAWTGLGFWPSWSLNERLSFVVDSRYLLGWGDTRDQLQLIPWLQYQIDDRNAFRLQASRTEILGDGESQQWFVGPFWIYDIGGGRQFRLGYQEGLEGEPDPRIVIGYNFNL